MTEIMKKIIDVDIRLDYDKEQLLRDAIEEIIKKVLENRNIKVVVIETLEESQ